MAQSKSETVLDEAKDLLAQGKRFMALEDFQSATDCLEQSCQLFDSYYGVAKRECADAYLEYGLALVSLANIEAGSGTDKITSASATEPTPGTSDGKQVDGQDDESVENEEATTIEIAWEVLCLAKRLFMTDESLEARLKLADTLQKLGEISIEWENNDNAVSILEECLAIRKAILPAEDRLIALTYYNLGLAHSFKSEVQLANTNFSKAIEVIERRISSLEKDLEKSKQAQETIAVSTYQKEINELKELLPDMTMRLDDSREDEIKDTEVLKRTREEMQKEDEDAKKVCLDKSKTVDDISHLVKRKAA